MDGEQPAATDLPYDLVDYLGGADGPFDWACRVRGWALQLREQRQWFAQRQTELKELINSPAWDMLAASAEPGGGSLAISNLTYLASPAGRLGLVEEAIGLGYRMGERMGFAAAANLVRRHEGHRAPDTSKLDSIIIEHLVTLKQQGAPWTALGVANDLIREREENSEIADRLKDARLPGNNLHLSRRITKIARQHGLLT